MSKELEAFESIKNGYVCGMGAGSIFNLRKKELDMFELIKSALERSEMLEKAFHTLSKDDEKTKKLLSLEIEKNRKIQILEEELGIDLKSASELLKWFVDNTMIASELMEFKKSSNHNERFEGWSHNGYPIQDEKFETMRDLARTIKYKNGIRH